MNTSSQFLFLSLIVIWFISLLAFGATTIHPDEKKALEAIAESLGKKDWNFDIDPCSNKPNWATPKPTPLTPRLSIVENNVTCNCSVAGDNFCHVVSITLKGQNLPGTLPPELSRLHYLQIIDLSRNYLNGTIPKEWGSMANLLNITLPSNRLTGSIPVEIANISTLIQLDLTANQLSDNIPGELGNLTQIRTLRFSSNNFTGELPATLAKLTTLLDFQISDNHFPGKIPDFIQNWTNINSLSIQGSGLSGPIPSKISLLRNLTDVRISDLNGFAYAPLPQFNNMPLLKNLILRNCKINGTLHDYLGTISTLKHLDLSFNNISGAIPSTYAETNGVKFIFLTGNLLTGSLPNWKKNIDVDISYNNLSNSQGNQICQSDKVNLFSPTLAHNNIGTNSCLRECPKPLYSLYINCGGKQATVNKTTYDYDSESSGAAKFHVSPTGTWAFSTTGIFIDGDQLGETYPPQNITTLTMADSELYTNARGSPISLTYYGFCLANGSYTVKLHFAEIMFRDDQTYGSLGRRVFDIYIQGNLVQKDFNIAEEAGGVGKKVIKLFKDVDVTSNTLEIRLYWAGKGTQSLPNRSVYGPLISAISVESDSPPGSISAGAVVGIVVAATVIIIILVFGILWWKGCFGKKNSLARELNSLDLQTGLFSLRQIKAATNYFDISNKIGEGGFGPVYKGCLPNGTLIAVKQLSSKSKQGNREFLNEIGMISALQHPYLVKLYGCCMEGDQLLLIYEYLENNSLARALFGPEEHQIKLDWSTRQKICVGIAKGLAYLHEESRLKVVHRDIKATNVLLATDLNPKISDFGLAKLDEEDNTHISTKIAGTYGYMAPEYAMHGYLTDKADVYSFGIVALEIVSGRSNTMHRAKEEAFYILDWAHLLKERGDLMELVDRRLGSDFNKKEAMVMINVGLLCTNVTSTLRPSMSSVVSMLEGRTVVPELVSGSSEVMDEKKLEVMRQHYHQIDETTITKSQTQSQSLSIDGPWTASSSSTDLHPIRNDSSYREERN
ncbi:probable leucine-rich repeat receptor-like serine/threonine-protein kinase At3g14840 isoform X2 [Trifolium pratense]|uniref:probable leucine-rich repeat receptor-like serine/threonine-protein kinase At3g14840 isoform X2 n=1 Tax=Trifolium pratense TaxID=57577 RepID=UPI001E692B58|nr:probable leucine-rich repeat receptor-like serine/threonine-protein kinase At3g14840 isoform X2 [Trifolium pratense]